MTGKTSRLAAGTAIMIIILTAMSAGAAFAAYVEQGVKDDVRHGGSANVIVLLREKQGETQGEIQAQEPAVSERAARGADSGIRAGDASGKISLRKEAVMRNQDAVLQRLKEKRGNISISSDDFKIRHRYSSINGFSGEINRAALQRLAEDPDVEAIFEVPVLKVSLSDSVPLINANNMHLIQAAGINLTGEGEAVCVIDTGIDTDHPAFVSPGKIAAQHCYCYINNVACCQGSAESESAEDDHGHGSHCANIAAGNGSAYQGVAPNAGIISIRVCNNEGKCDGAGMLAAIDWCVDNASKFNISAISMSIGDEGEYDSTDCPDFGFLQAINSARAAGIMIAIASGNDNYGSGVAWPACIANATAVGASTKSDQMASYTNTGGDRLDIIAPGDSIWSASKNGGYVTDSGTSMAAPHIAGAYLLMAQAARAGYGWSVDSIEQAFRESAGVHIEGYPRVDLVSSFNYLKYNYTINSSENSISRAGTGRIKFGQGINFTDAGDCINLSYNNISVDTADSSCLKYNVSSQLTISGLPWAHVKIMKDGAECQPGECALVSYSSGSAVFNVTGFSSYSAEGNFGLGIWDDTDYARKETGSQIVFYANFTDSAGGAIAGAAECNISFNLTGSWEGNSQMDYNATRLLYAYSRQFPSWGNFTFRVICDGTSEGCGTVNATDGFYTDLFPNTTSVIVNSSNLLNRTDESISCWAQGENEEHISLYAYYSWHNNSVLFSSGTASVVNGTMTLLSTIPASAVRKGQVWECRVFMGDGTANETGTVSSASLTIANTPAYFTQNLTNLTASENSTLYYDINCSDIDMDEGVDSIIYFMNGTLSSVINSSTGVINWSIGFADAGLHSYRATCWDGDDNVSQNFTINITNVNRVPYNGNAKVNASSAGNYSGDNITCWAYANDDDPEALTAYFKWHNGTAEYASGSSQFQPGAFSNISTLGSGTAKRNENWTCSVITGDGHANESSEWRNATILVRNSPPSFSHAAQNLAVQENSTLYYDINCSDYDSDAVQYSLNDTSRIAINATSGEMNWTPGFYDSGVYWLEASCSDGQDSSAMQFFVNVTNLEAYAPNLTVISPANGSAWTSSSTVTFTFNASDDSGIANCTLAVDNTTETSYSVANNALSTFSKALPNGNYNYTINCTDTYGKEASSETYEFTVSYTPPASTGGGGGGGGGVAAVCVNECDAGQRACLAGKEAFVECGNFDADECLEWGTETLCAAGEECLLGYCETINPAWYCEEWGECINSRKSRLCMDMKGIEGEKTETLACESVTITIGGAEAEQPAPAPEEGVFARIGNLASRAGAGIAGLASASYTRAKPYLIQGAKYASITLVIAAMAAMILYAVKGIGHSIEVSKEVAEYQNRIEDDFRRVLHIGQKKR